MWSPGSSRSGVRSRDFGPLRLSVATPSGWTLEPNSDPRLADFSADETRAASLVLPVQLEAPTVDGGGQQSGARSPAAADSAGDGFTPVTDTAGWRLDRAGERFRWTLPDQRGTWFWRLISGEDRAAVELGPALVDPETRQLVDPVTYPLDQILVIHHLHRVGGLLLHAAAVARNGSAVAAVGVSGAGKTTLARLLRQVSPDLDGLSDDRVIVAPTRDEPIPGWRIWGTPWAGEGRIASPASARLAALVVLRHADQDTLRPIDRSTALARMLPTVSIPWYAPHLAEKALGDLERLLEAVEVWELGFRPRPESVAPLLELLG